MSLEQWRKENQGKPVEQKTVWQKFAEKSTRKTAIDAKCHDCMGWARNKPRPQGVRSFIRDCTSNDCPLWSWRPYQAKVDGDEA